MKFGRRENLFAQDEIPPNANGNGNGNGNGNTKAMGTGSLRLEGATALPAPRPVEKKRPARAPNQLNAFLGTGCIYEGKLTFEGRVRIDGKFTGEIFSTDTLEIGPDAEIEAEIDVSTVIVAGRVTGNITARGRCDLRAPGIIVGNITSPIITMDEGVQFDGEMRMSTALDSAVRAPTMRASAAEEVDETSSLRGKPSGRRSAPASSAPDPSDLLK